MSLVAALSPQSSSSSPWNSRRRELLPLVRAVSELRGSVQSWELLRLPVKSVWRLLGEEGTWEDGIWLPDHALGEL